MQGLFDDGKAVDGTFLSEHVGYVPQENPLFEDLTVKDNLELWYANDKASLQKDLEDGWLFYFGMHKIYKKPVKKLSGGMKKDSVSAVHWLVIQMF